MRENAFKKGAPNMTSRSSCSWVNDVLLPNTTLQLEHHVKFLLQVARNWLHDMGFNVRRITKRVYVDGHERQDVVEYRGDFLKRMTALGFLHASNAPSEEAAVLLPTVDVSPDHEKTIFWFHDESSYNANDDQTTMWKDERNQAKG